VNAADTIAVRKITDLIVWSILPDRLGRYRSGYCDIFGGATKIYRDQVLKLKWKNSDVITDDGNGNVTGRILSKIMAAAAESTVTAVLKHLRLAPIHGKNAVESFRNKSAPNQAGLFQQIHLQQTLQGCICNGKYGQPI